jgi:hypothetical protein
MDVDEASVRTRDVLDRVEDAVITDRAFLESVLTGILASGHVLIEDVPGTGKTLTARCLAEALGLSFSRIQFTPDLLPSDVTGTHVYNERDKAFEFNRGPIFANMVLADEINRAPPKTQAALLEAMGEGQVTIDGETHALPDPFFVVATQNPVEQEGTFTLPEAQLDRFIVKTAMGYPDPDEEVKATGRSTVVGPHRWSGVPVRPEDQHALEGESAPPDEGGWVATTRHPLDDHAAGRHVDVRREDRDEYGDRRPRSIPPRPGNQEPDADGDLGEARQIDERKGCRQDRRHDLDVQLRHDEMQRAGDDVQRPHQIQERAFAPVEELAHRRQVGPQR